jgi:hypothetical protein
MEASGTLFSIAVKIGIRGVANPLDLKTHILHLWIRNSIEFFNDFSTEKGIADLSLGLFWYFKVLSHPPFI